MATSPQFTTTPFSSAVSFVNADGTTLKTLKTFGAYGGRAEHLRVSSTDTSARNLLIYMSIGGTDYLMGNMAIPAGSATNPAQIDCLAAMYTFVEKQFIIGAADAVIKVGMAVAVTAACTVSVFIDGGDY